MPNKLESKILDLSSIFYNLSPFFLVIKGKQGFHNKDNFFLNPIFGYKNLSILVQSTPKNSEL